MIFINYLHIDNMSIVAITMFMLGVCIKLIVNINRHNTLIHNILLI